MGRVALGILASPPRLLREPEHFASWRLSTDSERQQGLVPFSNTRIPANLRNQIFVTRMYYNPYDKELVSAILQSERNTTSSLSEIAANA